MPTPYTSGPHLFEVVGGEEKRFEIRAPHRGAVQTIKFSQIGGVAADCDFEVYTARTACPPTADAPSSSSSSSSTAMAAATAAAYSIFGERTMSAGDDFIESIAGGHSYRNADGTYSVPERKLYIRINPTGTGAKEYVLTLELLTALFQ